MIQMKWNFLKSIFVIAFFVVLLLKLPKATNAAYLKFDKDTLEVSSGETFTVDVIVDAGTDAIVSTDAYVKYDPSVLSVESINDGSFFDTVVSTKNSDNVYIAGMLSDVGDSKTGSGTVATITFKALSDSGTTLSYICDPNSTPTSKIIKNDTNATDVIVCSQNKTLAINSSGANANTTANNSPTPTSNTLPKTGFLDNLLKLSTGGLVLLFIGLISKKWAN